VYNIAHMTLGRRNPWRDWVEILHVGRYTRSIHPFIDNGRTWRPL